MSDTPLREFVCPRTQKPLLDHGTSWTTECGSYSYPTVDGLPVLVDFENSVLVETSYSEADDLEDTEARNLTVERAKPSRLRSFFKRLVAPEAKTRANVQELLARLREAEGRASVLIVGGATIGQGMGELYASESLAVTAFDVYPSDNIHFIADAHSIPYAAQTFDAIVVQAVLEHVLEPAVVVAEIFRVLKKDGLVYAETPFLQHVHEGAFDFTRFTESGHRALFRQFELCRSGVIGGAGSQLLWSLEYFFRGLFRSKKIGQCVRLAFFWLNYFDRLIPDSHNVDSASGCYFLGKKSSDTKTPQELVEHYRGAQ